MACLSTEFKNSVLRLANRLVPATRGCIYEVGPDLEPRAHVVSGGDTRWIKPYHELYRNLDPFHPRKIQYCKQAIIVPAHLSEAHSADPVYTREFMHKIGIRHKVEMLLRNGSGEIIAGLRLGRTLEMGDFDAQALHALETLKPLLEKACQHTWVSTAFPEASLTTRELEVLHFLLEALPDKAIAREMKVAVATVKLHVRSILRKLGVSTRAEAIVKAYRSGFR